MSANAHETGLGRLAPGLMMLRGYQSAWLRYDVAAGLSVAAVALPTAIAYAQLAGFPPVVGLYASILWPRFEPSQYPFGHIPECFR